MDAATLARACADAMWADDASSRALGLQLISVEPGQAMLAMAVTETMVNWHDTCHGGFVYLLADAAFGSRAIHAINAWSHNIAASVILRRRNAATG